jgi:hypothetical protein
MARDPFLCSNTKAAIAGLVRAVAKARLLLDVVVRAPVFELLAREEEALWSGRVPSLALILLLTFSVVSDGSTSSVIDLLVSVMTDLHAAAQAQHEVQRRAKCEAG